MNGPNLVSLPWAGLEDFSVDLGESLAASAATIPLDGLPQPPEEDDSPMGVDGLRPRYRGLFVETIVLSKLQLPRWKPRGFVIGDLLDDDDE